MFSTSLLSHNLREYISQSSPTREMNMNASLPCNCHNAACTQPTCTDVRTPPGNIATPTRAGAAAISSSSSNVGTPNNKNVVLATTPPNSGGSHHRGGVAGPKNSSCKRRRLASEDEENLGEGETPSSASNKAFVIVGSGSARKLNYESRSNSNDSDDTSDDSDDEEEQDPFHQEMIQMRQESILKKMRRLNYEDEEDQLLHTSAFAKLFEFVKDIDVVANTYKAMAAAAEKDAGSDASKDAVEGTWMHRGSGYVKVCCIVDLVPFSSYVVVLICFPPSMYWLLTTNVIPSLYIRILRSLYSLSNAWRRDIIVA